MLIYSVIHTCMINYSQMSLMYVSLSRLCLVLDHFNLIKPRRKNDETTTRFFFIRNWFYKKRVLDW